MGHCQGHALSSCVMRTRLLEVIPYHPVPTRPFPEQNSWEGAGDEPSAILSTLLSMPVDVEDKDSAGGNGQVVSPDHQDPHDGGTPPPKYRKVGGIHGSQNMTHIYQTVFKCKIQTPTKAL